MGAMACTGLGGHSGLVVEESGGFQNNPPVLGVGNQKEQRGKRRQSPQAGG